MVFLVFRNIYVIHDLYMENGAKKAEICGHKPSSMSCWRLVSYIIQCTTYIYTYAFIYTYIYILM